MEILRASHLGMCFGVRDAIALALERADAGPLTILGDLVHNPTVLSALEARGVAVAQDVGQVTTPTVMVTAHGTSQRILARVRTWTDLEPTLIGRVEELIDFVTGD